MDDVTPIPSGEVTFGAALGLHLRRCVAIVSAFALFVCVGAGTAEARWRRVSSTPSTSSPFYVCPASSRGARCAVIEDPAPRTERRGPLAAGAITKGPEEEVSPALNGAGAGGGFSPDNLRSAYDLPSATPGAGAGQTVAVVDAYDDPHAEADLAFYRHYYEIPACSKAENCFRKVNQFGESKNYPPPKGEWDTEISIDLDMVSAICPECHILLVEAETASTADLAKAESEAVALDATEISDSYTEPPGEAAKYADSYSHPGIPIAAAAGDHGYGYGVVAPAAFPGVIAVGGTTLTKENRGWSETAWGEAVNGKVSGTGSGCTTEPKPAWQNDSGCKSRTINDVAAVADPNTPVSVYDTEETTNPWLLLGGTERLDADRRSSNGAFRSLHAVLRRS